MPSSICIAVDSACDLIPPVIQKYKIEILPISVKLAGKTFVDLRDPQLTTQFYESEMKSKDFDAETEPYSANEMTHRIEQQLILEWDEVLVMTINSARSDIFENVRSAVFSSMPNFKAIRKQAQKSNPFKIRVFDTGTMFTGQAVLAYEALRLMNEEKENIQQVITQLEDIKDRVRSFLLPQDLYYLKNRASKKGDDSVGWLSYQVGTLLNVKPIIQCYKGETSPVDKTLGFNKGLEKLFNKTKDAVLTGLSVNIISMSYAGNLRDIEALKYYTEFLSFLKSQNIPSTLAVMSTTAAINVGPGAFSIAYAE